MDLIPSEEQQQLQQAVRTLCARLLPPARLRELVADDGWDEPLWAGLHELGVMALRRPEPADGLGLGLAEAALVFIELGAALVPGPLVATHLALTHLSDGQLRRPGPGFTAGVLDGRLTPALTTHLDRVDVVVGVDAAAVRLLDRAALDALGARPVGRPLDPLTPLHVVDQPGADAGFGDTVGGPGLVAAWDREGAVLTAALQVGIADAVLQRTVEYARTREQFGRPVGSQQAVKHRLADMLVQVTVARAAVLAAAVLGDDPGRDDPDVGDPDVGDPDRAASVAKLLADTAAVENGRAAVQLHGGMGFAWEVDIHLYLKRAWVNAQAWGTADDHAERLAAGTRPHH